MSEEEETYTDSSVDTSEEQDQQQPDPTQNLKAEFQRKFDNMQSTNQQLQQQLETIMSHLSSSQQQQQQASNSDDYEDVDPYDPNFYKKIKEDAVKEATQTVSRQQEEQNQRAQTLGQLVKNYPELNDDSSNLTQKALEKLGGLSQAKQQSAEGYKIAVYEAAQELGVLPVSKRKKEGSDVDEMIGEGGRGMRTPKTEASGSSKKSDKDKVDEKTKITAELFGLDVNDKEVIKRLSQYSKRQNWRKPQ